MNDADIARLKEGSIIVRIAPGVENFYSVGTLAKVIHKVEWGCYLQHNRPTRYGNISGEVLYSNELLKELYSITIESWYIDNRSSTQITEDKNPSWMDLDW